MQPSPQQIRAVSSNGSGSVTKPLQESLPTWRERVLTLIAKLLPANWERVTVNKNIDSVTVPKWIAIGILGAVLTFGIGQWYSRQAEHDTLIEIRTELKLAKEAQAEKDRTTNGKLGDIGAWQGVVNGKLSEIKGMLSQQQIDAINRKDQ